MKTKNYFNFLGGLKMLSLLAAVSFLISCGDDEDPKEKKQKVMQKRS